MNILRTLGEKPWLSPDTFTPSDMPIPYTPALARKKAALVIFLTVVTVLFSLFIVTFLARSQYPDFEALAGRIWQPFYNPAWLWVNTGMLAIASICMHMAVQSSHKLKIRRAMVFMGVAALFSIQFVIAQILLFRYLYGLGFYLASNPANSYFYMLTSVHALHLFGGVVVLLRIGMAYFRPPAGYSPSTGLSLCAIYWHYLLGLWVVLVLLTTSSPETYKLLAALCGY